MNDAVLAEERDSEELVRVGEHGVRVAETLLRAAVSVGLDFDLGELLEENEFLVDDDVAAVDDCSLVCVRCGWLAWGVFACACADAGCAGWSHVGGHVELE